MDEKIQAALEQIPSFESLKDGDGIRALALEELEQISGGTIDPEDGYITVDMSVYHCVYFSYAYGWALLFKGQGQSREEAIQSVYDYCYTNLHIIMKNLDQAITQEEWDRFG